MKIFVLLSLLLSSLPSFAYMSEVECVFRSRDTSIMMEVERPFPQGSMTKDARVEIISPRDRRFYNFSVMTYITRGLSKVRYNGGGYELEVDFWPDQRPQWGRTYRGRLMGHPAGHVGMNCRFPNAR